jgi:hypothetical protein
MYVCMYVCMYVGKNNFNTPRNVDLTCIASVVLPIALNNRALCEKRAPARIPLAPKSLLMPQIMCIYSPNIHTYMNTYIENGITDSSLIHT